MRVGSDWRKRPWREAFPGDRGRGSGIGAELAGSAARLEEPGAVNAAETGGGRRGAGILVGAFGGVSGDARTTMLSMI